MTEMTSLSYLNDAIEKLEDHFTHKVNNRELSQISIANDLKYVVTLSIGNPKIRARVLKESSTKLPHVFNKLRRKAMELVRKRHLDPQWIKVDFVKKVKTMSFETLERLIAKTRRNYFRYGISFDSEFRFALLEQELNGNAILRSVKDGAVEIDEKNMNHYLKYNLGKQRFPFMKNKYKNREVYIFTTTGSFIDKDNLKVIDLYNGELSNGVRKIEDIKNESISMIKKSTYFLTDQVLPSGQFIYGYFSAFAKKIDTYNILRHSSSLYAMAEGYEVIQDKKIINTVKRGINYLIHEAIIYKDENTAFVVDFTNNQEIKLGSNATAILAMTKYTEVTGDFQYIEIAQALAKGILQMKTTSGSFMHVLKYPTFEIKDLYRVIYYEGEAIFSLLRLYAIDKQELWLQEVKKSFDYFIKNDYWKHHDHWLSYAANEITIYEPEDKYFIFGLKNCNHRLEYIYHRETTYPTFLELTMAAYKLVGKVKELNKEYLLQYIDEEFLGETIDHRAEYQRVGFFYPEVAMYTKQPGLILNGYFIRHHSLRVRIDDVEHYLSGYCQYLHYRVPNLPEGFSTSLVGIK